MSDSRTEAEKLAFKKTITTLRQEIAWDWLSDIAQLVLDRAIAIQQIPAPTFAEGESGQYVKEQFQALGLENVEMDDRFNVYGVLRGENRGPGLMTMAHIDTVFPIETDLTIKRDGTRIYGPGLGDNSIGVASMMGLVEALKRANVILPCDLWLVATSGEEGLGDLRGIRQAYERVKPHIRAIINLEGSVLGHVYHAGIAVKRLCITATADGGHSWGHFGNASALHGIVQLGAKITAIQPPVKPKTTYNIGMIEGGQSINSIAAHAELWLDMRSEEQAVLDELEKQVLDHIESLRSDDLRFDIKVVGNRPAGAIATSHPLVQLAVTNLEQLGLEPVLRTGSTDGNIPLADGCPTITVGVTYGGNTHRVDEYIETQPIATGMQQIILLAMAAAQMK
jgi:tripeptide aminopeptidase